MKRIIRHIEASAKDHFFYHLASTFARWILILIKGVRGDYKNKGIIKLECFLTHNVRCRLLWQEVTLYKGPLTKRGWIILSFNFRGLNWSGLLSSTFGLLSSGILHSFLQMARPVSLFLFFFLYLFSWVLSDYNMTIFIGWVVCYKPLTDFPKA